MSQPTSTLSKFIGLTSLGLLTGSSLTLSILTTPTLLALPSTTPASQALAILTARTRSLQRLLSQTSLVALLAAWTLSPREARHPYLLWTALPVLGAVGWDFWRGPEAGSTSRDGLPVNKGKGRDKGKGKSVGFGSGSEDEDGWRRVEEAAAAAAAASEEGLNGESVRDGLLAFRQENTVKSTVYGLSFMLGLVGIWGDGY